MSDSSVKQDLPNLRALSALVDKLEAVACQYPPLLVSAAASIVRQRAEDMLSEHCAKDPGEWCCEPGCTQSVRYVRELGEGRKVWACAEHAKKWMVGPDGIDMRSPEEQS